MRTSALKYRICLVLLLSVATARRPNERKDRRRNRERKETLYSFASNFMPSCVRAQRYVPRNSIGLGEISCNLSPSPPRANAYAMNYGRRTVIMRKRRGNQPSREGGWRLTFALRISPNLRQGEALTLKIGLHGNSFPPLVEHTRGNHVLAGHIST